MDDIFEMIHDGYTFQISKEAVVNNDKIYGRYVDRGGAVQRILKKSIYGQIVRMKLVNNFMK